MHLSKIRPPLPTGQAARELRVIGDYGQSGIAPGLVPIATQPMAVTGIACCAIPVPIDLVWSGCWKSGMKRAIEQETLQALVETSAAREFRVLREDEAWRL